MNTLFFALRPPPELALRAVELTQRLRRDFGLRAPATDAERLHVTLHFLGREDAEPGLAERAMHAATSIRRPAFDLRLDVLTSFRHEGAKKPLVLTTHAVPQAVQVFRLELAVALRTAGISADKKRFLPHLTLLRDMGMLPEQSVAPFEWTVREFFLVRSLVGQGRHELLGQWALEG